MSALLLDTCAVIWVAEGASIANAAVAALDEAAQRGDPVCVSPMSAWEIGLLAAKGRLTISVSAEAWFTRLLATPGVQLSDLTVRALIASSFLPGLPPRDPADRIIIATARELGLRIVTRDQTILDYAAQGHVNALMC